MFDQNKLGVVWTLELATEQNWFGLRGPQNRCVQLKRSKIISYLLSDLLSFDGREQ